MLPPPVFSRCLSLGVLLKGFSVVAVALAFLLLFPQDTALGQSKPAAPTVWAVSALGKVTVYWVPLRGATGYETRYKKSSASEFSKWAKITPVLLRNGIENNGLDAGDEYTFEVRALSYTVKGDVATVKATPWLTRPAVTANAQREAVRLTWPWPSHGEVQVIDAYEYRQRKGTSGTWGDWTAAGSTGFKDGYTVASLTGDGSTYQFQLRAKAGGNAGPASETVSAKPYGGSGAVPSSPTGLTVEAGSNRVLISWTAAGDGVGGYCPTAGYYVRVYERSQEFPVVAESLRIDSGTSWYVEELPRNTYYMVELWGEAEDGCWAETVPLEHTFWMTQGAKAAPAEPSSRAKRVPFPVSNLVVEYTSTPGQVEIRWDKPRDYRQQAR